MRHGHHGDAGRATQELNQQVPHLWAAPGRRAATMGKTVVAAGAVAITLVATACSNSTNAGAGSSPGPSSGSGSNASIKIGVNEPFSGPFGFYGEFVANSLQAEADQVNSSGGILGRKISIVRRDNALDPQKAVQASQELANDPSVGLVEGPSFTSFFDATKQIYEQAHKVNCQVAVDGTDSLKGLKYAFRANQNAQITSQNLVKWLASQGVKSLGAVYQNDGEGQSFNAELAAAGKADGVAWLGNAAISPSATSHGTQVQAKMAKGAQAIFISNNSTEAAVTAASAAQVGYKGKLVSGNGLEGYTFLEGAGDAANGAVLSANYLGYFTKQSRDQWPAAYRAHVEQVEKQYGATTGPKSGVKSFKGTGTAADCVFLWSEAAKKAGSVDAAKVVSGWEGLSFPASKMPSAVSVSFGPDDHEEWSSPNQMYVYSWQHEGGKWFLKQLSGPAS